MFKNVFDSINKKREEKKDNTMKMSCVRRYGMNIHCNTNGKAYDHGL